MPKIEHSYSEEEQHQRTTLYVNLARTALETFYVDRDSRTVSWFVSSWRLLLTYLDTYYDLNDYYEEDYSHFSLVGQKDSLVHVNSLHHEGKVFNSIVFVGEKSEVSIDTSFVESFLNFIQHFFLLQMNPNFIESDYKKKDYYENE